MSLNNISKTFCSLPWNHTFIGPGGIEKPCCRFLLSQVGPIEELRESMIKGERHPGCRKCWEEEDAGRKRSLRQIHLVDDGFNQPLIEDLDVDNPKIVWLELSFSNRCNVRCRMCGPFYSTNWYKDWEIVEDYLAPRVPGVTDVKSFVKSNPKPVDYDCSILDKHLPNVRHIKMTGGEPFLIPEYRKILDKIVDMGIASQVTLNYSTNLTCKPKPDLIRLWEKFKQVEFCVSLDGVGDVIEYQRYPTKWDRVQEVLMDLYWVENSTVSLRGTVTIYNVLNLPDISWYWNEIFEHCPNVNFVQASSPEYLSITVLPKWAKEIVADRLPWSAPTIQINENFDHLINYMNNEDNSHLLPKFIDYTQKLDKARGQDFKKVVPEFASLW